MQQTTTRQTQMIALRRHCCEASQRLFQFVRSWAPTFIWKIWNLSFALTACAVRLFAGGCQETGGPKPKEPLVLYQYEGCPYCLKAREALNVLNLPYLCYPCPRETLKSNAFLLNSRFRQQLIKEAGRAQFPYLIDPNTKTGLYESDAIVNYLMTTYGGTQAPPINYRAAVNETFFTWTKPLLAMCRPLMDMGWMRTPATHRNLSKPLEVYTNEAQPFGRLVREALDTCEITYVMHPTPFNGTFPVKKAKSCWCCWGVFVKDPNQDREYTCANEFLEQVRTQWRTAPPAEEYWTQFGIDDLKAKTT